MPVCQSWFIETRDGLQCVKDGFKSARGCFTGAIDGLQRPRMVYSVHALVYRELAMVYMVSELV